MYYKLRISEHTEMKTEWLYAQDVVYYDYGNYKRHLQIIFPYKKVWQEGEKYPLILLIPGSAWHKQEMYNDIPKYAELAKRGYVVAAMEYRESDIAKFPAQVEDVYNALQFLPGIADTFHIDMESIFLMGNSSGGHIAMMTVLFNVHGLCGELPKLSGVILESGSTDILVCSKASLPPWMRVRPSAALLGVEAIEGNEELARNASCDRYITDVVELPPILLIHSELDPVVSVENSRILYAKLIETGHEAIYYELEGCDAHGGIIFYGKDVLDIIQNFCVTCVKDER